MKVGSLCTGILGAELALSMMGLEPDLRWYSEINKDACKVIARHTDAPNLGDLKCIEWERVEPVDILVAGYPCQPFSTAGKRRGVNDEQHLWPWICCAIRILRPRVVFLENVSAHLRLGFDTVLRDLAAIGFDAEWTTFRAAEVGACHGRNRLFVVATDPDQGRRTFRTDRGGSVSYGTTLTDAARLLPTPRTSDRKGGSPNRPGGGYLMADVVRNDLADWGKYLPAIERWEQITGEAAPAPTDGEGRLNPELVRWMMDFPPGWVDGISRTGQLKALGNAIVPRQAATAWAHLLGLPVSTEAGGASSANAPSLGQQRSRDTRNRRTGPQDSDPMPLVPTPTAWLGRRPAHSAGDPARWLDPARSSELSDFIAYLKGTP